MVEYISHVLKQLQRRQKLDQVFLHSIMYVQCKTTCYYKCSVSDGEAWGRMGSTFIKRRAHLSLVVTGEARVLLCSISVIICVKVNALFLGFDQIY